MRTIAYLVYGQRPEYEIELTGSVASAVRFLRAEPADIRLVLLTDRPGRRPDLPVEYVPFTAAQFAAWTGEGRYNHAAKIHALGALLDEADGPVALLDTDTYFTRHPAELFRRIGPGRAAMQAPDRLIGELDFWRPLLDCAPAIVAGYPISGASGMNNSGVIGVHPAQRSLIAQMVKLMAALHAISPVFNIEQFAVTTVLARHTELTTVPDVVHHYWPTYERWFVHAELESAGFAALAERFPPLGYPPKRAVDRLAARIRGVLHGWDGQRRFAYLAYRAALASRSPAHARVWARIAADALRAGAAPPAAVAADFHRMVRRPPAWLDDGQAAEWARLAGTA